MLFQPKPIDPVQPLRLERCLAVKNKDVQYLAGVVGVETYLLPKWSANTLPDEMTLVVIDENQAGEKFSQTVITDLLPYSVAARETHGWMIAGRRRDSLIYSH
jgi:hypothetical protein